MIITLMAFWRKKRKLENIKREIRDTLNPLFWNNKCGRKYAK
jgi:hypothetical protein